MDLDLLRWKGVDWSAGIKFQVAHFGINREEAAFDKEDLKIRKTNTNTNTKTKTKTKTFTKTKGKTLLT